MPQKFNKGDKVRFVVDYRPHNIRVGDIVEVVSDELEHIVWQDDYLVKVSNGKISFGVYLSRLEPVLGPLLSVEELLG
jgi:hypothetical protein